MKIYLGYFSRVLMAAIFIYAAYGKVLDPQSFVGNIESFQLLPYWAAVLTAYFLPSFEIVTAVGILTRIGWKGAWFLQTGLMLTFIVLIFVSWMRGLDIRCGCFDAGSDVASSYRNLFIRDGLMMIPLIFLGVGIFKGWFERR